MASYKLHFLASTFHTPPPRFNAILALNGRFGALLPLTEQDDIVSDCDFSDFMA